MGKITRATYTLLSNMEYSELQNLHQDDLDPLDLEFFLALCIRDGRGVSQDAKSFREKLEEGASAGSILSDVYLRTLKSLDRLSSDSAAGSIVAITCQDALENRDGVNKAELRQGEDSKDPENFSSGSYVEVFLFLTPLKEKDESSEKTTVLEVEEIGSDDQFFEKRLVKLLTEADGKENAEKSYERREALRLFDNLGLAHVLLSIAEVEDKNGKP